jgi:hypothetical protein
MATSDGYDHSGMSHFIKEFRNPFPNKSFIIEMEETMGCYGSLSIALLDGLLEYTDTKDMYTHSIKSPTLRLFCPSMYWRKSFLLSSSMANTLSLEFKL